MKAVKTIQESLIKYLKKLIIFLESKTVKENSKEIFPINSLAPKVLTEEKDLKPILPYLENLKQAIDTESINNIAITGSYGSGKSTILKTFRYQYPEYEYLNISLASFKENKEKSDDPEFEKRLEISILQQIFYHVEPSKIPDSRFKRIVNVTYKKALIFSISLILWCFSTLILFKFDYISKLDPQKWQYDHPLNWTTVLTSVVFFTGIGFLIKGIYRVFKNSKINKLNIKGELELGESIDKSVFNQYLEEILYFFERTKFNVVIIEDVDRFDSTDIFTKLREINILINNYNLIKRPVKFIYAIKDEMFKDKNERVKFFEFIIPVIPFINPSNASDQLTNLITHAKLQDVLSADFTSDVVTFIDDIDMRLLINIFHEYQLYKTMLSNELKQDNLFALIVYKNLHPDDFGDLQKRKGKLHDFFFKKPIYSTKITEKFKSQIEKINDQIELLENEIDKPIKELRAVYINKLVSKLDKFCAFHIDGENVSLNEVLEDDNFKKVKTATSISYIAYVARQINRNYNYTWEASPSTESTNVEINFLEIEKEISNKLTYNQREKLLTDKANNQINILKAEKEKIRSEINEMESMSIQKIFEVTGTEEYLGAFKENNLMRNLLLNGYIDEHYDDYISLFHEVNLTKEDFTFERKVKSGYNLPFDHTIIKTKNLIKRLPDHYFRKEEILNYNLLSFLLKNESKHKVKIDYFFKALSFDGEKQFEFIYGFIQNDPERINSFIKKLCAYKPSLWVYIYEKSGLPEEEIEGLVKHIFNYADKKSISKFNSLESLDIYISQMDNFFTFCSSLQQTSTIQSFVAERKIEFESLDLPNETQKQLFEVIYTKNLYQLNQHNIYSIIKGNGEDIDESKLHVAHYTTLLKSNLKDLISYINDNIEDYLEQILLLSEGNNDEEEETIVDILNRDDVSLDLKTQVVRSQNAKINSLNLIDDIEVKQVVLENNKLTINWGNIFDYYDTTEQDEFDDVLISFLNEQQNYETLSQQKLSIKERNEDYIKKISSTLLQCEPLEINAYTDLLNSLPYIYTRVNFNGLGVEKIEALLAKKILSLTSDNFNGLKEKGISLHIKIIEVHQNKFVEVMNEIALDTNDWLLIFKSNSVTVSNKLSIIKNMDNSVIINNRNIADVVCDILPNDQHIPLSYELLNAMFDVHNSLSKKIAILIFNFESLLDIQVQALVEKMGKEYAKIFMKQHKPTFSNNPQHIALFKKLQTRGLIIRYEILVKKDEIKVIAKY